MRKKFAVLVAFLIIAVIFQPLINGFISGGIFYLQKPDIIVKKDSEKITLRPGAPQYDEISRQALGLIFSHNNVYSQMEHALMLVHVGHVETAPHAQNRSYVQLPIDSPLYGKRIYVLLIDSSDSQRGGIYYSGVPGPGEDYFFKAYAAKNPGDFETLEGMIGEL